MRPVALRLRDRAHDWDVDWELAWEAAGAIEKAIGHIKTAIGSLDDPTGPQVVDDVRRVRDEILLDALVALQGYGSTPVHAPREDGGAEK